MSDVMAKSLAGEVRRRRTHLRMSQLELAESAGVARGTIINLEAGTGGTSHTTAVAVLEALGEAETERGSAPALLAAQREQIGSRLDALADVFPEDLFPDDATAPELIRVMRSVYRHAARIARGEA